MMPPKNSKGFFWIKKAMLTSRLNWLCIAAMMLSKVGKVENFDHIFTLACTIIGGVVRGKDKIGDVYQ